MRIILSAAAACLVAGAAGAAEPTRLDAAQLDWITASVAPAPAAQDILRLPAEILAVVIGDDSNSRMYWKLVDPGLAESAELGFNEYDGSGTWLTYLCSEPDLIESNLQLIQEIFDDVNANGITQEELEKGLIFKVGYRGVNSSDRRRPGTGLGLYDALKVAQKHKGHLNITSNPSLGNSREDYSNPFITTVSIQLPRNEHLI